MCPQGSSQIRLMVPALVNSLSLPGGGKVFYLVVERTAYTPCVCAVVCNQVNVSGSSLSSSYLTAKYPYKRSAARSLIGVKTTASYT